MAISNDTIIKKMIDELNQAKEKEHKQEQMVNHISNVKLLCELFLEEGPKKVVSTNKDEFSQVELKAMIGEKKVIENMQQDQWKKTQKIDHEEANGSSIFDF